MEITVERFNNGKYNLNTISNDQYIGNTLKQGYEWDGWMRYDVEKYYKPGTDIIDIGANIGYNTLMFSDYGPVVSFEPVFFEIANLNLKSNKLKNKVSMHPCALSDTIGEKIEMYLPKPVENNMINYGGTTMFPNEHHDMNSTITAITDTLDNVYKGTPSIIKMDVEGAEMNVLRGSISILKKHKPVLLIEIGDYEKSKIPDFLRDEIGYVCTPESRPECMYLFV
jgi:FkbM family methyltransferase